MDTTSTTSTTDQPQADERTALGRALIATRRANEELRARVAELTERVRHTETVRENWRTLAIERQQTIEALHNNQIEADDPRLSEFWKRAHEVATNAGHCRVFDDLVEELGGPPRTTTFDVEIEVSLTRTVTLSVEAPMNADTVDIENAITSEMVAEEFNSQVGEVDRYDVEGNWTIEDWRES